MTLRKGGVELALSEETRGAPRKLSGKGNGLVGCDRLFQSAAGTKRWTLDLLAGAMSRLTAHERLSRETVRRRLATPPRLKWMFTVDRARTKLATAYPDPAKES